MAQERSEKLTLPLSKTLSNLRLAYQEMCRNYKKKKSSLDAAGKAELEKCYDVLYALLNNLILLEKQIRNYKEVINDDWIAERHIAQLNRALKKTCDTTWLYDANKILENAAVEPVEWMLGIVFVLAVLVIVLPPSVSIFLLFSAASGIDSQYSLTGTVPAVVQFPDLLSGIYISQLFPICLCIALVAGLLLFAINITRDLSKDANPFNVNWQAFPELSESTCFIDGELHTRVRRWVGTPQETLVLPQKQKEKLEPIISANYKPFFKIVETQNNEATQPKPGVCLSNEDARALAGPSLK